MAATYTEEVDNIIRTTYARYGGRRTMQQLSDALQFYSLQNIHDRARTLGVQSPINRDDKRQPLWGPGETLGCYEIKKYIGLKRTDVLFTGSHVYWVKCRNENCAEESEKTEKALYQAEQRDIQKCPKCNYREKVEKEKNEKEETAKREREINQMYLWVMFIMPQVPLEYIEHKRRIDSQRTIR